MSQQQYNKELAKDIGSLTRDPLTWVLYSFPWGKGELANYAGPEQWQREALTYIRDNLTSRQPLRMAVASGHGIGKSTLVAWLILWSLSTCTDTRGVITANTGAQLKTKTWAELNKWHRLYIAKHWFSCDSTSISAAERGREKTWRIDSVVWSKESSEAFAGLHNKGKRIIVIFDEASAIDDAIWEVTEGALTDADTEIMWFAFGNPTRNSGRFRECFRKHRDLWRHVHIDSRSVSITNKEQLQQWIDIYGKDSDFVKVRVTGEFPNVSEQQLIGVDLIRAAMARTILEKDVKYAPKIMGVDIARSGSDSSAIWVRQGLYARRLFKKQESDSMRLADVIANYIRSELPDAVFLDMGAMGAPIYDRLRDLGFSDVVHGIYFQNSAIRDDLYVNRRSEMWNNTKLWLEHGGVLPDKAPESQDIEDDLTSPEYFYNTKGKMQLESKENMKERGLPSPDDGDALALTFAAPVALRDRTWGNWSNKESHNEKYDIRARWN